MIIGYVLIKAIPGYEQIVYTKLYKVSEIIEFHPLFGEYDFIAKVEGKDYDILGNIVVNKIRSIEGVKNTKTLTGTKFW